VTKRLVIALGSLSADEIQAELGNDFEFVANPTEENFAKAEGAIVRAEFHLDEAALQRLSSLKVAARTGVGVDRVDVEAATKRGVRILITPGANSNAVAEGTMAQLLHLSKRLGELTELVRDSRWSERETYNLGDLEGSTIGLVGFGRIGRRVGELAQAFGMKVLAFDPLADVPENSRVNSLDELLAASNYLSVHIPLTAETRNLIGSRELNLMPDKSVVVNCSRGGIVDLDAAYDALVSGKLRGLGLDSFDPEPALHHRVFDLPNVVLTPHVMGLSERAKKNTFLAAAAGVRNFLQGTKDYYAINEKLEGN
jgi:D-3-phosphoglycerate dehydrogenase / 2-oxoglutarate reductase